MGSVSRVAMPKSVEFLALLRHDGSWPDPAIVMHVRTAEGCAWFDPVTIAKDSKALSVAIALNSTRFFYDAHLASIPLAAFDDRFKVSVKMNPSQRKSIEIVTLDKTIKVFAKHGILTLVKAFVGLNVKTDIMGTRRKGNVGLARKFASALSVGVVPWGRDDFERA